MKTEKIEFEILAIFPYMPRQSDGHLPSLTNTMAFENAKDAVAWGVKEFGTKAIISVLWHDYEHMRCSMMRYPDHDA